ncbi:hypothetical protein [Micromonospora sp. NPDC048843]|uniref:pPIWI_RE_Z domain-containing protein n=1 Tax=Micromonospora sp. NPDC048843 TaxID=3155389 RepID=UPI00340CB706
MRDTSSWCEELQARLEAADFPKNALTSAEFCQAELGLAFMAAHFPGEPIGAMPAILSGYVAVAHDLVATVRRVRHRMRDTARRAYWRSTLNKYVALPAAIRAFERVDDPNRRVNDRTVFEPKATSVVAERDRFYAAAMADALAYSPVRGQHPPARAGGRYVFKVGDHREIVQFPDHLPSAPPLVALPTVAGRSRQPWTVDVDKDIVTTAHAVDEQLRERPDLRQGHYTKWVAEMRPSVVDAASGRLVDQPSQFTINGLEHWVGLMNSGKTTLADLLTINRVREHGDRVCLVVGSVGDVYQKVSALRNLGIDAVPLIGRSARSEHIGRYWTTHIDQAAELFPSGQYRPDPAAEYANASCLLEPLRVTNQATWTPLRPEEFPCRSRLRTVDTKQTRIHDCPLLTVCPAQKALREITAAQVWVTTPQCLVASRAEPASESMRWLEAVQHHIDLMIIDEADAVQQVFDQKFVQTEQLVSSDSGWTHRMVDCTNQGLANGEMAAVVHRGVQEWHRLLLIHQQAVFSLNQLALAESGQALRTLLGDTTFTAHALFRQVARTLYGLAPHTDGDKAAEDAAEAFYEQQLQALAEQPLVRHGHELEAAIDHMTRLPRDDDLVRETIDSWINASLSPQHTSRQRIDLDRDLLHLIIEAAIWSGRITTTFFRMVGLYPSVREPLRLPDDEMFMLAQPPRDYRPLVPEAPIGNLLALRWAASRSGGASLQIVWVHGVGRWLLHHAHDLLECEGVAGPHVIITSATSWIPGSSFYHIPQTPSLVLRQQERDRKALRTSTMLVKPGRTPANDPIFVSGRAGPARADALRQMVSYLCDVTPGRHRSRIDDLRAALPDDRRQVLLVTLSGRDARLVAEHINHKSALSARYVVPDAGGPQDGGIQRRLIARFGHSDDDILVAAEMSIQRGYNILNANDTAALGAVIYLTRSHPPPFDLGFPLSLVNQMAMRHLQHPFEALPGDVGAYVRQMRYAARDLWYDLIGHPVVFRTLDEDYRPAFVANNLVPMSQTIGRTIRGNQRTTAWLCDAAFAERLSTDDDAPDTKRTSLVVATDAFLTGLLSPPKAAADAEEHRQHAVNVAVWELMCHLVQTNQPLGSRRKHPRGQDQ